jgi:hypothetical protein
MLWMSSSWRAPTRDRQPGTIVTILIEGDEEKYLIA